MKTAASPLARGRLRGEAAALRQAAHPDVVRVGTFLDLADHTELHLVRAGDRTLLDAPPASGMAALECAATIAATVADLHAAGLVHGRLAPDHVVLRDDGRPALCGFADAGPGDPATDIRALGTLFELLAAAAAPARARPDRRALEAMLAAADHARRGQPIPRAADLVAALRTPPRRHGPTGFRTPRLPGVSGRRVALAAIAACAVLGIYVAGTSIGDHGTSVFTTATSDPTTAPPATSATTSIASDAPASALPSGAVRVSADGATFAVGRVGDSVVTGDWDCDGVTGAALLRPDRGEVYVFDRLAAPGESVTGRLVATLPGAASLEAVDQGGGCASLVIRHTDATPQVLPVEAR